MPWLNVVYYEWSNSCLLNCWSKTWDGNLYIAFKNVFTSFIGSSSEISGRPLKHCIPRDEFRFPRYQHTTSFLSGVCSHSMLSFIVGNQSSEIVNPSRFRHMSFMAWLFCAWNYATEQLCSQLNVFWVVCESSKTSVWLDLLSNDQTMKCTGLRNKR